MAAILLLWSKPYGLLSGGEEEEKQEKGLSYDRRVSLQRSFCEDARKRFGWCVMEVGDEGYKCGFANSFVKTYCDTGLLTEERKCASGAGSKRTKQNVGPVAQQSA